MMRRIQTIRNLAGLEGVVFAACLVLTAFNLSVVGNAFAGPGPGISLVWPVVEADPQARSLSQDYAQFDDAVADHHHAGLDIPAPSGTGPQ